jgi:hypothetical protein
MQLFYFLLKAGGRTFPDPEGQELADVAAARDHAIAVAQELMHNREIQTMGWRIQVCDDYLLPLFDVAFVEASERLQMYPPELRVSIRRYARRASVFCDTLADVKGTLADVWDTVARADRVLASIARSQL